MTKTAEQIVFHSVLSPINKYRVQCLLVSALEGGSNYWYTEAHYKLPKGTTYKDFQEGGKHTDPNDYYHPLEIIPFVEGCALTVLVEDFDGKNNDKPKRWELDTAKMKRGLELMAEKYPHHWADFINENDDAITADVWFQLSLFGELIFG